MKKIRLAAASLLLGGLLLCTGCGSHERTESPKLPQTADKTPRESYLYALEEDSLLRYSERGQLLGREILGLVDRAVQSRTDDTIYYTDDESVLFSYQWGQQPQQLGQTDDGAFFVTNGAVYYLQKGEVVRRSLQSGEEKILLDGVERLFGVSGSSLYFVREEGSEILEYNVKTQSERILSTETEFYSVDKSRLVCTSESGSGVEVSLVDLTSGATQNFTLPSRDFVLRGEEAYYLEPESGFLSCKNWVSGQSRVVCEKSLAHLTLIGEAIFACDGDYRNYLRYDCETGQTSELFDQLRGALIVPLDESESSATTKK